MDQNCFSENHTDPRLYAFGYVGVIFASTGAEIALRKETALTAMLYPRAEIIHRSGRVKYAEIPIAE